MCGNSAILIFIATFGITTCAALEHSESASKELIGGPINEASLETLIQCAPEIVHLLNLLWVIPEDSEIDRSKLLYNEFNKAVAAVSQKVSNIFSQVEGNTEWLIVVNREIQESVDNMLELLYFPNITGNEFFRYSTTAFREGLTRSAKTAVHMAFLNTQMWNKAKQELIIDLSAAINKSALTTVHHDEVVVAVGMIIKRFADASVLFKQLQPKTESLQELMYGTKTLFVFGEAEPKELIKLRPAITDNLVVIFEKCSEVMLIAQCYVDISRSYVMSNLRRTAEIIHIGNRFRRDTSKSDRTA